MSESLITFRLTEKMKRDLGVIMKDGKYNSIAEAIEVALGNKAFMDSFIQNGDNVDVIKTDKVSKKQIRLQMK